MLVFGGWDKAWSCRPCWGDQRLPTNFPMLFPVSRCPTFGDAWGYGLRNLRRAQIDERIGAVTA